MHFRALASVVLALPAVLASASAQKADVPHVVKLSVHEKPGYDGHVHELKHAAGHTKHGKNESSQRGDPAAVHVEGTRTQPIDGSAEAHPDHDSHFGRDRGYLETRQYDELAFEPAQYTHDGELYEVQIHEPYMWSEEDDAVADGEYMKHELEMQDGAEDSEDHSRYAVRLRRAQAHHAKIASKKVGASGLKQITRQQIVARSKQAKRTGSRPSASPKPKTL